LISRATYLWFMGVSFVKQKKRGIGWTKDERMEAGSKKQVKKRQDRNKARSLKTLNLLISEIRARRMVGCLLNDLI